MQSPRPGVLSAITGGWGARISWLVVGVAGIWSIGDALDGRSNAVRATVAAACWLAWGTGLFSLLVPSPLGLTISRMTLALAVSASITSWVAGADAAPGAVVLAWDT